MAQAAAVPERKTYGLTPRELEVVTCIVEGCSNKDIAKQFSISEETVKRHLSNVFDKTGVSTRLELALFAISHKLVEPRHEHKGSLSNTEKPPSPAAFAFATDVKPSPSALFPQSTFYPIVAPSGMHQLAPTARLHPSPGQRPGLESPQSSRAEGPTQKLSTCRNPSPLSSFTLSSALKTGIHFSTKISGCACGPPISPRSRAIMTVIAFARAA